VTLHAQAERLEALRDEERVERRDRGADVAQVLHAQLGDEGRRPERLREHEPVVAGVGLGEAGVLVAVGAVVEGPAVDDDPGDGRAVPTDVLRGGVDDRVDTVLERVEQVGRGDGVVDEERHADLLRHGRDGLQVEHVALRVADGLAEERLGVLLHRGAPGVGVVVVLDERHLDTELRERVAQQRVGAAVEAGRRDDVVAGLGDVGQRAGRGRLARCEQQRADTALERGQPLLDGVLRRVHDARVDVARLRQAEQVGGVLGVAELVRRRLVDRQRAGTGGRVWRLAGVDLLGLERPLVTHGVSSAVAAGVASGVSRGGSPPWHGVRGPRRRLRIRDVRGSTDGSATGRRG
jgi:hypothetical protein